MVETIGTSAVQVTGKLVGEVETVGASEVGIADKVAGALEVTGEIAAKGKDRRPSGPPAEGCRPWRLSGGLAARASGRISARPATLRRSDLLSR
jgi:hypothetical protein